MVAPPHPVGWGVGHRTGPTGRRYSISRSILWMEQKPKGCAFHESRRGLGFGFGVGADASGSAAPCGGQREGGARGASHPPPGQHVPPPRVTHKAIGGTDFLA